MEKNSGALDRWLRPIGAGFIVILGLSFILLSFVVRERGATSESPGFTDKILFSATFLENWFYDLRTARFYQHNKKSPNLIVLDITDGALNKVGRWPWTRSRHATILHNLKAYGAKVVMFDVLFPEPEGDLPDQAFADAIQSFTESGRNAVVLGYGITNHPEDALEPFPEVLYLSGITGNTGDLPMSGAQFIDKNNFAAAKLTETNALFGFISATPDMDGVFRHLQLANELEKTFLPSLGLSGFASFYSNSQDRKVLLDRAANQVDYELRILSNEGERKFRLNPRGELKVRFFGGEPNFERVSIDQVALDENPEQNEALKAIFSNKAVLIGSSAFGAHDLRHTPVHAQTPGMYMHANLFHVLDQNLSFRGEDESMFLSFALYILGISSISLLSRMRDPLYETGGALLVIGGIYAADYFYFSPQGYNIRLFSCLNGSIGLYAWFTVLNVFKEAQEKKKIRDTFTRYVAPEIVKEMLSHPDKLKVGGEKKEITMLFSDVRDFTTLSERLSPQELATLLNIYMGRMTDILFETGGTLDKYIGDALVGFWGAPLDLPDHAYKAVHGAKLMLEALPEINREFEKKKFPRINVGIGLNTGEVSVGNMGSDRIFQYTALGDNMNLASRLEGLTKFYGVNLLISEFTFEKLGAKQKEFRMRPLDLVQVKGKSKAVKIYEVIPNWSPWAKEDALLAKYTSAYENSYLGRRFEEAFKTFEEILQSLPEDKATLKLKENCETFLASPPPSDWDGVTIFTTK